MEIGSEKKKIFSLSTVFETFGIIVAIVFSVLACMAAFTVPCVSSYYSELPVYPDAELVDRNSDIFNWIGATPLVFTYHSEDDSSTVRAWYRETVDGARYAAQRAGITGDPAPDVWNHTYQVTNEDGITEIRLVARCSI